MGQSANPRRLSESEALASAKMIRGSPQKLNLVAQLIRGKTASAALASNSPSASVASRMR